MPKKKHLTHFLFLKKGKLVKAVKYGDSKVWKMITSKEISLLKDEYFSSKTQDHMQQTLQPRDEGFEIIRSDNTYAYTI